MYQCIENGFPNCHFRKWIGLNSGEIVVGDICFEVLLVEQILHAVGLHHKGSVNLIHIQDVSLFIKHCDFGITSHDKILRFTVKQEYCCPFQLAINDEFQFVQQLFIGASEVVFCHTFASQCFSAKDIETLNVKVLVGDIVNGNGIPFHSCAFEQKMSES